MALLIQQIKANWRHLREVIKREPLIATWKERYHRFKIEYITGITEFWYKHGWLDQDNDSIKHYLIPEDPFEGRAIVEISNQYLYNQLDSDAEQKEHHFILKCKDWRKGNFLERRLSIQRLLIRLMKEGWRDVNYLNDELVEDFKKMVEIDLNRYNLNQSIVGVETNSQYSSAGCKLVEHFFPWGDQGKNTLKEAWDDQMKLYRAIRKLLLHNKNVTRHNMFLKLYRYGIGKYNISPNFYRAVFRQFGIKDMTVADPYPGAGSKAIAAVVEGCSYYADSPYLAGLSKFLNVDFSGLNAREHYDCVIIHSDWRDDRSQDIVEWQKRADMVLVFVPDEFRGNFPNPLGRVRIVSRRLEGVIGWIYHYA